MRDNRPQLIYSLFSSTTTTGDTTALLKIQQRAILLLKLNRAVNMLLPPLLRPWFRVANVRHGVLVLETANASWKLRLRYEQFELLSMLRAQILPSLSSIDIRINPSLSKRHRLNVKYNYIPQHMEGKPRHLSAQSALFILHVAAQSNGKLKNTLERLAALAG